jgi:hypothetical protein
MAQPIVSLNYILRPAPGEKGILLVEKNCWERGPGVAETNPPQWFLERFFPIMAFGPGNM